MGQGTAPDDCEDCGHAFKSHEYFETPNLECTVRGCGCQHYVNPEDVENFGGV